MKLRHFRNACKLVPLLAAVSLTLSSCVFPFTSGSKTVSPKTKETVPAPGSSAENTLPASNAAPQNSYWQTYTLDRGPKVGAFSSIAVGQDNNLYVAYLDDENDDLKLVAYGKGSWKLTKSATKSVDGFYPSIALDPQGRPFASYYDMDEQALMYGRLTQKGWRAETVVSKVEISGTALVFNPAGQPVIVFYDTRTGQIGFAAKTGNQWAVQEITQAEMAIPSLPARFGPDGRLHLVYSTKNQALIYATLEENGTLQPQTIQNGISDEADPALAFDPDGTPHVSYYDSGKKALMHAALNTGQWQVDVVDGNVNAGPFPSIAVDTSHQVHISYYDQTNRSLKYAYGRAGRWNVWTIDDQRAVGKNSSLALDPNGDPHISYYDSTKQALRYAVIHLREPNQQKLSAVHRDGQTFLTWREQTGLQGETYQVYRSSKPIDGSNFKKASLLAQVGENSSRFYANYHDDGDHIHWDPRYSDKFIIQDGGLPLPDNTGLLVWTLAPEDLAGGSSGSGYYAVTVTPPGGKEIFSQDYLAGPVSETVQDPQPVDISQTPGLNTDPNRHLYIQYMDLRNWNPTFHAPNKTNNYYGFDQNTPGIAQSLQYAYDYTVFSPTKKDCGGKVPDKLPVTVFLHGFRGNRYGETTLNPYPSCAYLIIPIDVTETWYFGFAQKHDYRQGGDITAGDKIENYTEQRILWMVFNLLKHPPGPPADEQRVFVFGHSMGGSGALAFAERYPNVFAAAYSGQPITNYLTAGVTDKNWAANVAEKWGKAAENLPIYLDAPAGWADHLQKFNGTGVWDWQNYLTALTRQPASDMAPLGIDHGIPDDVIIWSTQGEPFYQALSSVKQAWGGWVTSASHEWSNFAGLMPSLGSSSAPFWNFTVVRDETVPGISRLSSSPASIPEGAQVYNGTVMWSSSWNPWDGSPVDQANRWQMSLCAVTPGSTSCGTGASLTVDITPRRLQKFQVIPGKSYDWINEQITGGKVMASGTIAADRDGIITVPGFQVSPGGNRLILQPHQN